MMINPTLFVGAVQHAKYAPMRVPKYAGNPLIEALGPLLEPQQVIQKLRRRAEFSPDWRSWPDHERLHAIQTILDFYEPMPRDLELQQSISRMLCGGLRARNPFLHASYWRSEKEKRKILHRVFSSPEEEKEFNKDPEGYIQKNMPNHDTGNGRLKYQSLDKYRKTRVPSHSSAFGMGIIGDSGIGKSRTIEEILLLYPQLIIHQCYKEQDFNFHQIVWAKIDCPHDGSIKTLCGQILLYFDNILGGKTNYFETYARNGRASVAQMVLAIGKVAALHSLGILVIDEIQHLNEAKSGGINKMLNFFVSLINITGLPVLLIGTDEAQQIFDGAFRQARRLSGQGLPIWYPLQNTDDMGKENNLWTYFLEALWEYQYTRTFVPLTEDIDTALYYESQGIEDIAIKLFLFAQMRAIAVGEEKISVEIIHSIARDSLTFLQPFLDKFRDPTQKPTKHIPYVSPDIETFLELALLQLSHNEDIVSYLRATRLEHSPSHLPSSSETDKENRHNRVKKKLQSTGLVAIHETAVKNGISVFEALTESNVIKDYSEFYGWMLGNK